jgi:O-antigen/teichoic acid export membrane protein
MQDRVSPQPYRLAQAAQENSPRMKTRRLLLNTGSNYGILVMRIGITFLLTPLYVKYLGVYDFGIWELVVATLGYAGLLDLGLGFSISRFIAKYRAEDNHDELLRVFNTVMAFLSSIGLVLALVGLSIAIWCPQILGPASGGQRSYSLFLTIIAVQVFVSFPGVVAGGCLDGYQKYYVKNFLTFIDAIFVLTITLLFINKDNALILLASLSTFSLLWKCVAYLVLLAREPDYPLYFARHHVSGSTLRSLLGFAIKSFVQGVSNQIQSRSGVFLIGAFLGPGSVPLFTIPANLVAYQGNITETGSQAFMPVFSALEAQGRRDEILQMYLFASKILVALMSLMGMGLLLLGTDFITLWVGPQLGGSASNLLPYMVSGTFILYLNPCAPRYLTALGKHGIYAKVAPVALVVSVLIAVSLVGKLGVAAIVVGAMFASAISCTFTLRLSCRLLGISVVTYLKRALLPLVLPGCVMVLTVLLLKNFVPLRNYAQIFGVAIAASVVYAAAFFVVGLSKAERGSLLGLIWKQRAAGIQNAPPGPDV